MSKPKRERTARREAARRAERLGRAREQLFVREPGGAPDRPIEVDSAAVVEIRARSVRCPRCQGEQAVEEHSAVSPGGNRLREVRLGCQQCGARRSLWFRLPVLN